MDTVPKKVHIPPKTKQNCKCIFLWHIPPHDLAELFSRYFQECDEKISFKEVLAQEYSYGQVIIN